MQSLNKVTVVSQTRLSDVSYEILLQLFPFGLILNKDVKIIKAGQKVYLSHHKWSMFSVKRKKFCLKLTIVLGSPYNKRPILAKQGLL